MMEQNGTPYFRRIIKEWPSGCATEGSQCTSRKHSYVMLGILSNQTIYRALPIESRGVPSKSRIEGTNKSVIIFDIVEYSG